MKIISKIVIKYKSTQCFKSVNKGLYSGKISFLEKYTNIEVIKNFVHIT